MNRAVTEIKINTQKRRPGRPGIHTDGAAHRVNVSLDSVTIELLKRINTNISAAIRIAARRITGV